MNISALLMVQLDHIGTKVDNVASEFWAWQYIIRSATAVGPLLQEAELILLQTRTHESYTGIAGKDTKEAYVVSCSMNLLVSHFNIRFNTLFPQPKTW